MVSNTEVHFLTAFPLSVGRAVDTNMVLAVPFESWFTLIIDIRAPSEVLSDGCALSISSHFLVFAVLSELVFANDRRVCPIQDPL